MTLQLYIDKGYLTSERAQQLESDSSLLGILRSDKIFQCIRRHSSVHNSWG
ncbi:hypothetical protein A0O36_02693 [Piscirickettsiaceae bacterium NZ-RLO1]|nr:hypothetical protein A0O36_02693 [Piscirickettsiaceae bacterium NZ-RLO1]